MDISPPPVVAGVPFSLFAPSTTRPLSPPRPRESNPRIWIGRPYRVSKRRPATPAYRAYRRAAPYRTALTMTDVTDVTDMTDMTDACGLEGGVLSCAGEMRYDG